MAVPAAVSIPSSSSSSELLSTSASYSPAPAPPRSVTPILMKITMLAVQMRRYQVSAYVRNNRGRHDVGRRRPTTAVERTCSCGAGVLNSWYSEDRAPRALSSTDLMRSCTRRSFSKFSTDEVVVQDPDPPPSAPQSPASAMTKGIPANETPGASQSLAHRVRTRKNASDAKLVSELQEARELFHQIKTEGEALLRNLQGSSSCEEVVATADYFLVLVNSLDLEKSLELVQSLQSVKHEQAEEGTKSNSVEETVAEVKLRQAMKSMSQLHYIFLNMVESSLPLKSAVKEVDFHSKSSDDITPLDNEMYSATTVGRALRLSRRADELGLPMHRPLYQRLAVGLVLASYTEQRSASASLIMPGQFQQIKDGSHSPPLSLELMDVFQHARTGLKVISQDNLQQLAEDIFAEPFLVLLKQKRFEECMGLLRGWQGLFGRDEGIDLMNLIGESNLHNVIDVAKGMFLGSRQEMEEEVKRNPHLLDLVNLLEVSLTEVLKDQKQRAQKLSQLLVQLSLQTEEDEDYEVESDSDSDFEDEFDYDSDEEDELDTTDGYITSDSSLAVGSRRSVDGKLKPFVAKADGNNSITMASCADDENARKRVGEDEDDSELSTIIKGMSDKEARRSIYLRNGVDWALPDVVSQLEGWNKGNQLTFTHEFEKYLGRQLWPEGKGENDD
ncbi:hypothetical protein ACHAWF_013337 [Thalassiosira exigua]